MKIGAIVRSIGERTENLCVNALQESINTEDICVIKDISPPYEVYIKQFEHIKNTNYDYTLCIDADVIMRKNWMTIIKKNLDINEPNKASKYVIPVFDYLTQTSLCRGIHIYPKHMAPLFLYAAQCAKHIGRNEILSKQVEGGILTKVESTLHHFFHCLGLNCLKCEGIIGWHGFEQNPEEIFRQYAVRRRRSPSLASHPDYSCFLSPNVRMQDLNFAQQIARLGWDNYELIKPCEDIHCIKKNITLFFEKNGLNIEKSDINLSLTQFRNKYTLPDKEIQKIECINDSNSKKILNKIRYAFSKLNSKQTNSK